MTVSIHDIQVPKTKKQLLDDAQEVVDKIAKNYRRGLITEEERYKEVIETWKKTDDRLTHDLLTGLDKYNNIFMMADSGARGSDKQIKQLAGMRGLMADTTGHTIELPIRSNFREGLDVLEYFISAHGARKGLSDTALRTADSGYLTRRLVDVSQDLIVREDDCCAATGEIPFMEIKAFMDGQETIESLQDRITGRFIAEDITDPDTGAVVLAKNNMVTPRTSGAVMDKFHSEVFYLPPFTKDATFVKDEKLYALTSEHIDNVYVVSEFEGKASFEKELQANIQMMFMGDLTPQEVLDNTMQYYAEQIKQ